jgi:hypothetical protein
LEGCFVVFFFIPALVPCNAVYTIGREVPDSYSGEQTRLARRHSYACKSAVKSHVVSNHKKLVLETACEKNSEEKVEFRETESTGLNTVARVLTSQILPGPATLIFHQAIQVVRSSPGLLQYYKLNT